MQSAVRGTKVRYLDLFSEAAKVGMPEGVVPSSTAEGTRSHSVSSAAAEAPPALELRDEVQALKRQLDAKESEMERKTSMLTARLLIKDREISSQTALAEKREKELGRAKEQLTAMQARKDAELRELRDEIKHLRQLAATVEVHDVDEGRSTVVEDCEVEGAAERVARERNAGPAQLDLDDILDALRHVTWHGTLVHPLVAGQRCSSMLRARLDKVKKEKVEQEEYVSEAIECEVWRPHSMPSVAHSSYPRMMSIIPA